MALARLAFSRAKVWVLDEPFTALDKSGVAELEARLTAHATGGGLVLVTSHQDINVRDLQALNLLDFPVDPQSLNSCEEAAYG